MRARKIVATALLLGVLGLAACASPSTVAVGADADAPRSAPTATATSPETTPTDTDPAAPEPDAPESEKPAEGAYLEFEDGIIERTTGPKVLFFHAPWCPQCRKLDEQLQAEGAPEGLTVIKVDYDSRTDLRQKYGVTLQTTVVFVDDSGELVSSTVLYDDPSIASLVVATP